jgi:Protein of unknown function (DUF3761)
MKLPSIPLILSLLALTLAPGLGAPIAPLSAAHARNVCGGSNYYVNSRGRCVHRPVFTNSAPSGASARCRDGSYSFSQSRRGTCSHHGGVAQWL